jgi:DNA-binding PadR family transcriptional regulator
MSRDASSLLPLTPAVFHVLLAIAEGDTHGYAILKDVARRTEGRVVLSTGTLYGIVKRLLADGLIEESRRRPPAAEDDERRRYYRLTPFGRAVAAAEADRLAQMIATARTRRLIPGRGRA